MFTRVLGGTLNSQPWEAARKDSSWVRLSIRVRLQIQVPASLPLIIQGDLAEIQRE
jgi:hypothetical protein